MELTINDVLGIAGWLLGGGSIGGVLTWRWVRRKAKAEAQTAEVNMAKEVQDIYQQALADKDKELSYYKKDGEEQRNRLDQMEEKMRELQDRVARNGRQLECLRPLLCGRQGCPDRINVTVSADGEVKTTRNKKEAGITPYGEAPDE